MSTPKPDEKTDHDDSEEILEVQSPFTLNGQNALMVAFAIVAVATTGYFIGLKAPMTASYDEDAPTVRQLSHLADAAPLEAGVIPATPYSQIASAVDTQHQDMVSKLASLKQTPYDPMATITVREEDKLVSLAEREKRRAFNGAPPTVPHSIDQLSNTSCMACHGDGLKSQTLRAGKMPHPYYSSCTQCHVENKAKFAEPTAAFQNSFTGLPAPTAGDRAFATAPPVVPHSTWMRNECLSCHGRTANPGMETTHPWRENCMQCHVGSARLDQTRLLATPGFLPPPEVISDNE